MLPPLQIMWTAQLRQRFANDGRVVFYALNPGEVMTDVVRSLPSYIGRLYRLLLKQILLTPMEGKLLCLLDQYCLCSKLAVRPISTAKYYLNLCAYSNKSVVQVTQLFLVTRGKGFRSLCYRSAWTSK